MDLKLRVWRQSGPDAPGRFEEWWERRRERGTRPIDNVIAALVIVAFFVAIGLLLVATYGR